MKDKDKLLLIGFASGFVAAVAVISLMLLG